MGSTVRDAAAVVLVREAGRRRETFWVRRGREVSLGGGFYAFPGGSLDPGDRAMAAALGTEALRVAALRELFEETGVLLASTPFDSAAARRERRALLAGERAFAGAVRALGARLDPARLDAAGRWLTPDFAPVRFDARFFLARMPPDQVAEVWPGELVDGEWVTPDEALNRWSRAKALLHPPAKHLLQCLRDAGPPACLARMVTPADAIDFVGQRIDFQRGILFVPLKTPTLPPATHTNCAVVGEEELVVVDPGSPYREEQAKLAKLCHGLRSEGRVFREILLTHEHADHVGGVEALRRELDVPVRAHRLVAERLEGEVPVDGVIEPEERIRLQGALSLSLRAIHTPGHARGHLAFLEENSGTLLAGDLVAGVGTVIIDPPEGDMRDYVASLRKVRALGVGAIFPAHGPVLPDGPGLLDATLAHRVERENRVLRALAACGPSTPGALVPHVYTDVAESAYPMATRSLLAELRKLVQEGRAVADGERFRLAGGGS